MTFKFNDESFELKHLEDASYYDHNFYEIILNDSNILDFSCSPILYEEYDECSNTYEYWIGDWKDGSFEEHLHISYNTVCLIED